MLAFFQDVAQAVAGVIPGAPLQGVLECRYAYEHYRTTRTRESSAHSILFPSFTRVMKSDTGLAVGNTPLYASPTLAKRAGIKQVWLKVDPGAHAANVIAAAKSG